jgi:2-keto-4-pentenoate hydratase/2-oxohepta-3-ene-1,7-dioic acid hydratase in catechol pathway
MKLVVYTRAGVTGLVGVLENDRVTDVTEWIGGDLLSLLRNGDEGISQLQSSIKEESSQNFPLESVTLEAPVVPHVRIFGIGLNYEEHAAESKMQPQKVPTVFLKLASSVVGPGHPIELPAMSTQPDYEAELAVVIGKGGHRIAAADWEQHVAGYTILNDVSARDVQLATTQWTLGKSFPTFTPVGPAIVTKDEIPDPHTLDIRLAIDGELLQNSNTKYLIFRVPQLIEYLSSIVPLEPGDIISTGTPPGVGLGRTPQRWIQPNEEILIEIPPIGKLVNRAVATE